MESDSTHLVERASRGDPTAIEPLLEHYLPDLRAYFAHRAGYGVLTRESASDLVQSICRETLEHLRNGRLRFRGEPQFRQWLYRAALMKMSHRRRHWRAERRDAGREDGLELEGSSTPAQATDTPSEDAMLYEELQRFERAFEQLSDSYREAIQMHHVEGLPHAEVAKRLGVSESYSRTLLARALSKLARLKP